MTAPDTTRDRDPVTWLGLAVVGVAAAVLSFSALADLGHLSGLTGEVEVKGRTLRAAWLLPLTVDVLACVATRIWLRNRATAEAVLVARRAAWVAIGATVVGNGYHGYLAQSGAKPPLLVAMVVGAVPAVVLGVLVHLAVLVGRPPGVPSDERAAPLGLVARLRPVAAVLAAPFVNLARLARRNTARQAAGGGDQADRAPTGADTNEVLAADLRRLNAARRADGLDPLGRDAVIARYRPLGSTRAGTVMKMADRPEPTDGLHVVPNRGEAAG